MSPESAAGRALPGRLLDGRYRVGAVIARGGMSTVYRGVDTRLGRAVAIKIMSDSYVADPSFLVRFQREARVAASLRDPAVVAVYDQGRDQTDDHDVVFLVMELIDGGTLRDLLRENGSLPVPVALSVLEPVLGALAAAHAAGLVHRDVKPENVLISGKGEVKVADFGLARAVASQTMATGNVILGTVAYLSPEQVSTGTADPRSDVYSAGILAFEMLTGRTPYSGDNPISVAYQHVHSDVPPVTDEAPAIPVELDDIILAATRRDPAARPRDAGELLSTLIRMRARLGIRRVPVPVPRALDHRPVTNVRRSPDSGHPDAMTQLRDEPVSRRVGATRVAHPADEHPTRAAIAGPLDPAEPATVRRRKRTTVLTPDDTGHPARAHHAPPPVLPDPYRVSRRTRLRRWLIVAVVILLLAALAAAGGWWLGGRWAYTPSSIGVDQPTAEQLVRQAGLIPEVTTGPDNVVPSGAVTATDPRAGSKVLRGSTVRLTVSTGRPTVPAIDPGSTVQTASELISAAHLTPRIDPARGVYDDTVPAGDVTGTDPGAGTSLDIGTTVSVVVSMGARPVPIPSVTGKNTEDAQNALLVAGFQIGPSQPRFAADVPAGTVIGTQPDTGTDAPHGSAVALIVAASLTIPDVTGSPIKDAETELAEAGFQVTVGDPIFDPAFTGGRVALIDPAPGTRIDPSAPTVTISASNAVTVPALAGRTLADARDQLAAVGLTAVPRGLLPTDGSSVIGQDPTAGTAVSPGSTVVLSVFP